MLTKDDQRDILEGVIEKMDEIAQALRSLDRQGELITCAWCAGAGPESGRPVDLATARELGWKKRAEGWLCDACLAIDEILR